MQELLRRGAWRTLRNADGLLPLELAVAGGHDHLIEDLQVPETASRRAEECAVLDERFRLLALQVIEECGATARLRFPQTSVLAERFQPLRRETLWFPVPGMLGGFTLMLTSTGLLVESWSRGSDGSGLKHFLTAEQTLLVDEAFV